MGYIITGTGSYIPKKTKKNIDFINSSFYNEDGSRINTPNAETISKFESITGIKERKYVSENLNTSEIGYFASLEAIKSAKIDPETIDYIIFAHNFGDVMHGVNQYEAMPSLAAKVKSKLKIKNPKCVCYDIIFGCPGWVEGLIQAKAFLESGMAKKCLVIGAETLSRVVDHHDRDTMIFSDGAGASLIENKNIEGGILSHNSATYTYNGETEMLFIGNSYNKNIKDRFIKMKGRKVYEFALNNVPNAMKESLELANVEIENLKKIFIHQANKKMDDAIMKRFFRLYKLKVPNSIMPMNIEHHGNNSVATIPTLYDQVIRNEKKDHSLKKGDIILFASVGAGMNINSIVYQV